MVSFLPTFLIDQLGTPVQTPAELTAFAIFMNGVGCLLGGWLLRIGVQAWLMIAAGFVGMLLAGLGIFNEGLPGELRYALAAFLPLAGGMVVPAVVARVPAHAVSAALAATAIGLTLQAVSGAQLIGPPILGAIVTTSGSWAPVAWYTTSMALIGLAAAGWLRRLDRRL